MAFYNPQLFFCLLYMFCEYMDDRFTRRLWVIGLTEGVSFAVDFHVLSSVEYSAFEPREGFRWVCDLPG
jgi:hypothetical protein